MKGDQNPNWSGGPVALKCEWCKADFTVPPLRKDTARFCSMPCANEWQKAVSLGKGQRRKPYVTVHCVVCQAPIEVQPSQIERKRTCSPECSRRLVRVVHLKDNGNVYSNRKIGKRADLGGQFFRSAWEANYARFLNLLIAQKAIERWEYEADTFWFEKIRRGVRSYTPDFKVHTTVGYYYVEVKGWMDPRSATKIKRMAKYHPTIDLRVVAAKEYKALAKQVSAIIPEWE